MDAPSPHCLPCALRPFAVVLLATHGVVAHPGDILAEMSDNTVGGEKYDREWPERARQTMW